MLTRQFKLICLTLCLSLFVSQTVQARFGGAGGVGRPGNIGGAGGVGGFNHPDYNNQHNNNYIGNYRPGYGWGEPNVVVTNPEVIDNDTDCQSVQQCDAYGNCVQTTQCD